jgi:hypothetical protein
MQAVLVPDLKNPFHSPGNRVSHSKKSILSAQQAHFRACQNPKISWDSNAKTILGINSAPLKTYAHDEFDSPVQVLRIIALLWFCLPTPQKSRAMQSHHPPERRPEQQSQYWHDRDEIYNERKSHASHLHRDGLSSRTNWLPGKTIRVNNANVCLITHKCL